MKTVGLYKTEWYPVYEMDSEDDGMEVSDDLYDRYCLSLQAWKEVQSELRKLYEKRS